MSVTILNFAVSPPHWYPVGFQRGSPFDSRAVFAHSLGDGPSTGEAQERKPRIERKYQINILYSYPVCSTSGYDVGGPRWWAKRRPVTKRPALPTAPRGSGTDCRFFPIGDTARREFRDRSTEGTRSRDEYSTTQSFRSKARCSARRIGIDQERHP